MDKILKCGELHPWEADENLQKLTVPEYVLGKVGKVNEGTSDSFLVINAESGEEFQHSEVENMSSSVASWFFADGMKHGDVLIFLNRDFFKLAAFHLGVWRANGVVRASYPQDLPETLAERIRESKAKWVYCDQTEVETTRKAVELIEWKVRIIVNGKANNCVSLDELLAHKGKVPPLEITPKDPALILLTSGTSGPSKGAVRTHEQLICLIINAATVGYVDRTYFLAAATHIGGTAIGLTILTSGNTVIFGWNFQPEKILQTIQKYKVQEVFGFPSFIVAAAAHPKRHEYDISSVKYICTIGTVITPTIYNTIKALYNATVLTVYGLTESLFMASYFRVEDKNTIRVELQERRGYEVGTALPGVQLRIADIDTGESLGHNKNGEIQIKALETITEYLNNPKKTAEAFTSDGFLKTGDVGSYDENGVLSIFGRSKEVFKYHNNHISPNYIDGIIGEHPAVLEVCTVGVPDLDGCNFVPRVFLVLKPGKAISKEQLIAFAHEKLPDYMHLRGGLHILEGIPRTNTGKVATHLLAQLKPE